MTKKFRKFISDTFGRISDSFRQSSTTRDQTDFDSLAPIDTADSDNHYFNALNWALKTRRENSIKNIALTGPYGSGKSSILKSFQKKCSKKDFRFLNISLATFKEEIGKTDKPNEIELLRLIELSILQQIFYRVKDSKIPDSRFKKIKSYNALNLWATASGLLIFTLAIINYNAPEFLKSFLRYSNVGQTFLLTIHYSTYGAIVIGIFILLLKSIRIIASITFNKLKIQNAEIGLGDSVNKSILNNHIDEIIYFFEVTEYNIVIIEDLDRFKETEIFTKLREINLLLNNSEKTQHKDIAFIYAVRDDMFRDKDRTKFFDFILPIVPVINSTNSGQILREKRQKLKYHLSDDLIDSISLFIDDMRLLHNISNEFQIYLHKLESNLSHDKLLAMLVYKNIQPNDFTLLSNNRGVLYDCINSKYQIIEREIDRLKKEIEEIKIEIKNLEDISITNIAELRRLYLLAAVSKTTNFQSFVINDSLIGFDELVNKQSNWDCLTSDVVLYRRLYPHTYNPTQTRDDSILAFREIEKIVSKKTYLEREKEIEGLKSNRIDALKRKINDVEQRIIITRSSKLKNILEKDPSFVFQNNKKVNQDLVKVLLRSGYIAEDYHDYITIFYEGSITRSDNQFLLSIKSQRKLENSYRLGKIENLISKINPADYSSEYVLNYDLVEYILIDKNYSGIKSQIFKKISDESRSSIEFVVGYTERTTTANEFFKSLCQAWPNVWNFIENDSNFPSEFKIKYLKLILEFGELSDIKLIADKSKLRMSIANNKLFSSKLEDTQKLRSIIRELNIKFVSIETEQSTNEFLDFLYENSFYELNYEMLNLFIKKKGNFNQTEFEKSNFYSIKNSKALTLVNYVQENLNLYINNVYLRIETNRNENEETLIELLNSELSFENKILVVEFTETKIEKLEKIIDPEIQTTIFNKSKVKPSWENLLLEYNKSKEEISDSIVAYLNIAKNAMELSLAKIPSETESREKNIAFTKALLSTEDILDYSYGLITKSCPWSFTAIDIKKLSRNKVISLIDNSVLAISKEYLQVLKSSFSPLQIRLIERSKESYLEKLAEFSIDSDDLKFLLNSSKLSSSEKNIVLDSLQDSTINADLENLRLITILVLSDNKFSVKDSVVKSVILNSAISTTDRIKFFNIKHEQIPTELAKEFLSGLGELYSNILIPGKKISLDRNSLSLMFSEILKEKEIITSLEFDKKKIIIAT